MKKSPSSSISRRSALLSLLVPVLALTACGGGGGGGGSSDVIGGAPAVPPVTTDPTPVSPAPSPAMAKWTEGTGPATTNAREVFAPALAMSRNGTTLMVWAQSEGRAPEVSRLYASFAEPGSNAWGEPALLSNDAAGTLQTTDSVSGWNQGNNSFQVAWHPSTGNAIVIWRTQNSDEYVGTLWTRTWNAQTKQWGAATSIASNMVSTPKMTTSTAGHIAIAWQSLDLDTNANAVNVRVIGPDSQEVTHVATGAEFALGRLVVDTNGRVTMTWPRSSRQMLAQTGTASWSAPVEIGETRYYLEWFYDLAVAPDGQVSVAWTDPNGSVASIIYKSSSQYSYPSPFRVSLTSGTPSVRWTPKGWAMTFISSPVQPDGYGSANVLQNALWFTRLDPKSPQWVSPIEVGPVGEGTLQLFASDNGDLLAVGKGYQVSGYRMGADETTWTRTSIMWDGRAPIVTHDPKSGQSAMGWVKESGLETWFWR